MLGEALVVVGVAAVGVVVIYTIFITARHKQSSASKILFYYRIILQ
jgi:hypothetical protein